MNIYYSGYGENFANPHLLLDPNNNYIWLEPADFINKADSFDPSEGKLKFLWLYRAPWTLLLDASVFQHEIPTNALDEWTYWQRESLRLKHKLLSYQLINNETINTDTSNTDSSNTQNPPIISAVFAKIFEWVSPECWDIYELLDLAASNRTDNPASRSDIDISYPNALIDTARLFHAGFSLPATLRRHTENVNKINLQAAEIQQITIQMEQLEDKIKSTQNEKQKLQNLNNKLTQKIDVIKKELLESDSQLQLEKDNNLALTKENKKFIRIAGAYEMSKATIKEIQEENELILLQLYQAQKDLHHYYSSCEQMTDLLKRVFNTMNAARTVISSPTVNL